ncbi:MAG: tRNA (cytidine(34)-2'-O)-methyltransferase [bacterium]|nr:tRNA (cytidine(34)-2'-O)-methyltransferase [bacterium]
MDSKAFTIALIEPEIPPNTGNIARLCAATGTRLDLVGPLGFDISDKAVRRAGLDYWDQVNLRRFEESAAYMDELDPERVFLLSTKAPVPYHQAQFKPGDWLVFGPETRGLPQAYLSRFKSLRIPQFNPKVRSLNLSNCCALVLYEALRQTGKLDESP